jgi:hypothetical protein
VSAALTLEAAMDAAVLLIAEGERENGPLLVVPVERERAAFLDNRKLDSDRSRM